MRSATDQMKLVLSEKPLEATASAPFAKVLLASLHYWLMILVL